MICLLSLTGWCKGSDWERVKFSHGFPFKTTLPAHITIVQISFLLEGVQRHNSPGLPPCGEAGLSGTDLCLLLGHTVRCHDVEALGLERVRRGQGTWGMGGTEVTSLSRRGENPEPGDEQLDRVNWVKAPKRARKRAGG